MKKLYSVLLVLAVFLSLAVSRASAEGGYLEFVEARNDRDGLVIIIFNIHGDPNLGSLRQGKIFFVGNDSEPFDLHCKLEEGTADTPDKLICSTTRQVADHFVNIQLGEFYFYSIFIPPSSGTPVFVGGSTQSAPNCYNVYDLRFTENPQGAGFIWELISTQHCPASVPSDGAVINIPDPYQFDVDNNACLSEAPGVGVGYYAFCPR